MSDFTRYWGEATRLDRGRIAGRSPDWQKAPDPFKTYPGAPVMELIPPKNLETPPADLWNALHLRRSVRRYLPAPLSLADLSALLWACQGITARQGPYHLRTSPSAGALYPFETYVFLNRVEGVAPGLAHLDVRNFRLEKIVEGDLSEKLVKAALNQKFLAQAAAVFAFTSVPARASWKYGDRSSRYIALDIGHACQNLCLAAVGLGLGSCAVGAFLDGEIDSIMNLDGTDESIFYLLPVGKPSRD